MSYLKLPQEIIESYRDNFTLGDDHEMCWVYSKESPTSEITIQQIKDIFFDINNIFEWIIFKEIRIGLEEDYLWEVNSKKSPLTWLTYLSEKHKDRGFQEQLLSIDFLFKFTTKEEKNNFSEVRSNGYIGVEFEDSFFTITVSIDDYIFYKEGTALLFDKIVEEKILEHNKDLLKDSLQKIEQIIDMNLYDFYTSNRSDVYTLDKYNINEK